MLSCIYRSCFYSTTPLYLHANSAEDGPHRKCSRHGEHWKGSCTIYSHFKTENLVLRQFKDVFLCLCLQSCTCMLEERSLISGTSSAALEAVHLWQFSLSEWVDRYFWCVVNVCVQCLNIHFPFNLFVFFFFLLLVTLNKVLMQGELMFLCDSMYEHMSIVMIYAGIQQTLPSDQITY